MLKQCLYCNELKSLDDFYSPSHKACKYCFNINARIGHLCGLPNTFSYDDFEYVRLKFGISKEDVKQYDLDHFIPESWGHGGSHLGNVYLLKRQYNKMKGASNPFHAFDRITQKHPTFEPTAKMIINHIAKMNNLTIEELKEFVGWCERNKRQDFRSEKTSLELWKDAM
jgi:hypothetical protein